MARYILAEYEGRLHSTFSKDTVKKLYNSDCIVFCETLDNKVLLTGIIPANKIEVLSKRAFEYLTCTAEHFKNEKLG